MAGGGGEVGRCREHQDQVLDYWCREEGVEVCAHCLILGAHFGRQATTRQSCAHIFIGRLS